MSSPGLVGSLVAKLGIDAREFHGGIGDAQKSLGGFGVSSQTAFKVAGAAAAMGFGIATKGALEAEAAQGKFMAATGATREEAKAFVTQMDGLAGTAGAVGMSFEEIAATGTMVAQQFGTTGAETQALTGHILEFSKVTGQDAAGAAAALEDTLSAFGLEAGDAAGFMDQLVASNQKFGTDAGPEALDILNKMAPALTTMGMGLDDGVELLNAFEVAGLDASSAQKGLQAAIKELEPGQNLDDLITQIGAIEDPTARAQKAIEIFGTKAGVGLAKVIQPGMTSLDEFGLSAEEAAGTTGKAADDMLTFTDRLQGWADKAMAGAREMGQQFGPLVTGLSSLASIGAPFAKGLTGMFTGLLRHVGILGAATAVGTATGGAQAAGHEAAATGPTVIKSLITKIGAMAIPLAPAGTTVGTAVGAAMSAGMTAGLVLGIPLIAAGLLFVWLDATEKAKAQIRNNPISIGPEDLFQGRAPMWAKLKVEAAQEMQGISAEALAAFNAEWDRGIASGALATKELVEKARQAGLAVGGAWGEGVLQSSGSWLPVVERVGEDIGVGLGQATGHGFVQTKDQIADDLRESLVFAGKTAEVTREIGQRAGHELAMGLNDSLPGVHDQWEQFKKDMNHTLDPMAELTWLKGKLNGRKLAEGLESTNPLQVAAAELMRDTIQGKVDDLERLLGIDGAKAGDAVGDNLASPANRSNANRAGGDLSDAAHNGIDSRPWGTWGSGAAGEWVSGFVSGISHKQDFIERKLENLFKTNSPPKVAPHIDDHGIKTGELWGLSVLKGGMAALSSGFNSVFAPTFTPAFATSSPLGGGSVTIESGAVSIVVNGSTDPQGTADAVEDRMLDLLGRVFPIARPRVRHTAGA